MSRTVAQKTNENGFPKAAEVIEISGAHELEAMDRAIFNILYENAHDSGRLAEPDAEFEIPAARLRPAGHEGNDRLLPTLLRLMRVIVSIPYTGAPNDDHPGGEPRVIVTGLFSFFDLSREERTVPTVVRYGLPKKLQPIIARSGRWGRIKAEVVCAMTSKYAIALYELVQLRINLDLKCAETFPINQFRELMGVPPGKLLRGADFTRWVLETAALEVNGLSDVKVKLAAVRRSPRAPITAVCVEWSRKEPWERSAAELELKRPKVGRMARLKGTVEQLAPTAPLLEDVVAHFARRIRALSPDAKKEPDEREQITEELLAMALSGNEALDSLSFTLPDGTVIALKRSDTAAEHKAALFKLYEALGGGNHFPQSSGE